MRTIEIKEVTLASGEAMDYMELCNACLKASAPQGFSTDEMEVRLKALAEFPVSKREPGKPKPKSRIKSVDVSEVVYGELLKCVDAFRWGMVDQVFVDFTKYIRALATAPETSAKK